MGSRTSDDDGPIVARAPSIAKAMLIDWGPVPESHPPYPTTRNRFANHAVACLKRYRALS